MPLPPSVPHDELHLRRIELHGYRRHDGLYDIEARIVDTKTSELGLRSQPVSGAGALRRVPVLLDRLLRRRRTAMKRAGLPIGRKEGGYTFHMARNTAATDLRAGGMDEADAMKITGHQTAHVFKHYDLGDVDALRDRLTRARAQVSTLRTQRRRDTTGEQRVTG